MTDDSKNDNEESVTTPLAREAESPNEALAVLVASDLVDAGLIDVTDRVRFQRELASGQLDGSGWKLLLENALARRKGTQ